MNKFLMIIGAIPLCGQSDVLKKIGFEYVVAGSEFWGEDLQERLRIGIETTCNPRPILEKALSQEVWEMILTFCKENQCAPCFTFGWWEFKPENHRKLHQLISQAAKLTPDGGEFYFFIISDLYHFSNGEVVPAEKFSPEYYIKPEKSNWLKRIFR